MTEILIAIYCLGYIVCCILVSAGLFFKLKEDMEEINLISFLLTVMLVSLASWFLVIDIVNKK